MKNFFDKVCSLLKNYCYDYFNYYLKRNTIWAWVREVPGSSEFDPHTDHDNLFFFLFFVFCCFFFAIVVAVIVVLLRDSKTFKSWCSPLFSKRLMENTESNTVLQSICYFIALEERSLDGRLLSVSGNRESPRQRLQKLKGVDRRAKVVTQTIPNTSSSLPDSRISVFFYLYEYLRRWS